MTNNLTPAFEVLRMSPTNTNSLLLTVGNDCVIFDAWGLASDWEKLIESRNLNLRAIYATHGHPDHISAAPALADRYNVPWYLNQADNDLILWGNALLDMFGIPRIPDDFAQPQDLPAGEYEVLPNVWMQAINSPGHTPGGMMLLFPDYDILLIGDTLFQDSVGRTDFPGGSDNALAQSINTLREMDLSDETYVVHGHGMDTTIAWLKQHNPYLQVCHCGHCHTESHCCCGHCHEENHNKDCCGHCHND